jgi:hypothetical protein
VLWFLFGNVCWTLWLNRNDFIFNNRIISSPLCANLSIDFLFAALDGGEYRHGQSSAGTEGRRGQVSSV